jgi:hypothetical protein
VDISVPDAAVNPSVVLYLNPRIVTLAPLIAVIFPFKVAVAEPMLVTAAVVIDGAVIHDVTVAVTANLVALSMPFIVWLA